MSLRFKKEDYDIMARRRKSALETIAQHLGKNHQITKMMGSMAWGRNDFESGPDRGLQDAIRETSALDGVFYVLNIWARDNDRDAQRFMLDTYPRGFERKP